jgi:hypothetical protein
MVAVVAITAVIALSMSVFVAAPARAAADTTQVNAATQLCLDGSISRGVRLEPCNGSGYQQWDYLTFDGDNTRLKNQATSMCLDGSISNGVRLNSCNGSDYQEWEYRWEGNDVAFLNIATRKCLDGSISEGVRLKTCNNSDYQRWY